MLDVFSITLPIFLLIGLGFASTRFGATSAADIRALGGFVIRFAMPALIFKSLAERRFAEIANADYLLVYASGSLVAYLLMFALARALKPGDRAAQAFQALGSAAPNSGFVGFPIALIAVGPPASLALSLSMIPENLLIIPLALTLAESARHRGKSVASIVAALAASLARNPLILAIALGAVASLAGLRLPSPLARSVDMLAMASGGVALFAVGGALVGLKGERLAADVPRIVAGKLILHPMAIFAVALLFPGLDPALRKSMLIFASAPMLSIYPLLGRAYGFEPLAAASLLAATALSFLSLSTALIVM